jgi:prepilin-type N-terminal cleavage/methylation domain-containing protein
VVKQSKELKRVRGKHDQGFTLIEMAVVLVIIATIMTLGLGALTTLMTTSSYSATKAKQARIKDALIAYLGANRRLPCPDDPTGGITGTEDLAGGSCSAASNFGVVPWATLGLGRDVAEDDWGGFFSYQVYAGGGACPGTGLDWTRDTCFGEGKSGGLWVYSGLLRSPPALAAMAYYAAGPPIVDSRAVAAIVSHGPNSLGAWAREGTRNAMPPASSCEETLNASRSISGGPGCSSLPSSPPTPGTTFITGERTENDDVVAYLTATETINRLAKQGDILSATAKVNEDLGTIARDQIGQVLSAAYPPAPGSAPPVLTCPLAICLDPWGNPYLYPGNIASIDDHGVVTPVAGATSAICIYSFGPNGTVNTARASCSSAGGGGDDIRLNVTVYALGTHFINSACSPTC